MSTTDSNPNPKPDNFTGLCNTVSIDFGIKELSLDDLPIEPDSDLPSDHNYPNTVSWNRDTDDDDGVRNINDK